MASVFLCDDSSSFRMLARLNLEDRGHRIVGECAGADCLVEDLRAADPEIVLLDGSLTDDLSVSTLRDELPGAKFVMYSGMPQGRVEEMARAAGADAGLSKERPFDDLAELLAGLLAAPS